MPNSAVSQSHKLLKSPSRNRNVQILISEKVMRNMSSWRIQQSLQIISKWLVMMFGQTGHTSELSRSVLLNVRRLFGVAPPPRCAALTSRDAALEARTPAEETVRLRSGFPRWSMMALMTERDTREDGVHQRLVSGLISDKEKRNVSTDLPAASGLSAALSELMQSPTRRARTQKEDETV